MIVKLRGGKSIRGRLHDFDQYMNLVIQDAVELLNKNDHDSIGANNRLGTVLLRADNILIIAIESSIWETSRVRKGQSYNQQYQLVVSIIHNLVSGS